MKKNKKQKLIHDSSSFDFDQLYLFGFIILLIIIFLIGIIHGFKDTIVTKKNYYVMSEVISLKSKSNVDGLFILGSGIINQVDYYYFLEKDTTYNGYVKKKIPSSNTLIIEKDTTPNLKINYSWKQEITRYPFILDPDTTETSKWYSLFNPIPEEVKYEYILTIPPGSITQNIKWEAI